MEEEDRPRVWELYGWFSGLMCVGSVFGVVAWAAWMQYLAATFTDFAPGLSEVEHKSWEALCQFRLAVFSIAYAIEFLCLSVAKLLVLHRMADFAVPKGDGLSRRFAVWGRVVMAAVVVGNVVGLCANAASAAYAVESGNLYSSSAAANAANKTDSISYMNEANRNNSFQKEAASLQMFCEVAVLLIIILAFAVVGIASARRVSSALRYMNDEHGAAGRQLQRQIVGTTAFVFVTFLLRAVFAVMNALANALQNQSAACAATDNNLCDPTCYNVWFIMQQWLMYTPEFQLIVVLISSPLALIVALWGMTSKRMLQHMQSSHRQALIGGAELRMR